MSIYLGERFERTPGKLLRQGNNTPITINITRYFFCGFHIPPFSILFVPDGIQVSTSPYVKLLFYYTTRMQESMRDPEIFALKF